MEHTQGTTYDMKYNPARYAAFGNLVPLPREIREIIACLACEESHICEQMIRDYADFPSRSQELGALAQPPRTFVGVAWIVLHDETLATIRGCRPPS